MVYKRLRTQHTDAAASRSALAPYPWRREHVCQRDSQFRRPAFLRKRVIRVAAPRGRYCRAVVALLEVLVHNALKRQAGCANSPGLQCSQRRVRSIWLAR